MKTTSKPVAREKLLKALELSARHRLHHLMQAYRGEGGSIDREQLRIRIEVLNDLIAVMSGVKL